MRKTLLALLFAVVPFSVFAQDGPAANREITAQPGQELRDLEAIRYTRLIALHAIGAVATEKTEPLVMPIDGVVEEIIFAMVAGADVNFQVAVNKHEENASTLSLVGVANIDDRTEFGKGGIVRMNTRTRVSKGDSLSFHVDGAAGTGSIIAWIRIAY